MLVVCAVFRGRGPVAAFLHADRRAVWFGGPDGPCEDLPVGTGNQELGPRSEGGDGTGCTSVANRLGLALLDRYLARAGYGWQQAARAAGAGQPGQPAAPRRRDQRGTITARTVSSATGPTAAARHCGCPSTPAASAGVLAAAVAAAVLAGRL